MKSRKNKFSKTFDIQSTIAGKISSQTRARCDAKYGDRKQGKLVGGDLLPLTYFLIDVLNILDSSSFFKEWKKLSTKALS